MSIFITRDDFNKLKVEEFKKVIEDIEWNINQKIYEMYEDYLKISILYPESTNTFLIQLVQKKNISTELFEFIKQKFCGKQKYKDFNFRIRDIKGLFPEFEFKFYFQ